MLLAVMFLLVGVPNAPVLSTNATHLRPFLEQTFNGTVSTETSRLKSTSNDIVPLPSTFRPGTMLTNAALERSTLCITSVIPDSAPHNLSQSISSSSFIGSSANHIDSTAPDTTIPTTDRSLLFAAIRNTPPTTTRSIPPTTTKRMLTSTESTPTTTKSNPSTTTRSTPTTTTTPIIIRSTSITTRSTPTTIRSTPPTTTRNTHPTTNRRRPPTTTRRTSLLATRSTPTTTRGTTEDQRSTTESFRETSVEVPTTISQERSHIEDAGILNSMSEVATTGLPRRTTNPVPPLWSNEKALNISSMTYFGTTTTLSESPPTLEPITFRRDASTLTHRKQTTLNPGVKSTLSTLIPLSTTTGLQSGSSTSLEARLYITSNPILAFPKLAVPLASQNRQHADVLGNVVEPMRHLPWNSQKTSAFSENEFGNVFHPTKPSVFPRKATIPLKNGRSGDTKKATTPSAVVLRKPEAPNPDYYKYTTSSTLPVLNLLGNQRLLRTTSAPMTRASIGDPVVSQTMPLLPVKTSAGNQSAVRPVDSPQGASTYPKLPHVVSPPVPTRNKSQSALHPIFSVGRSSPDKQKLPSNVPPFPVHTKNKNQSVLHPGMPPSAKLPQVLPPFRLTNTETLPPEILPTIAEMDSAIVNLTQNCSNDYCVSDEDYIDMMLEYMFPTDYEWVLIGMHGIVFIGGLVGNALVCLAVYRNHSMRTVTNYFIVNLAVADFLVILLCLPPTVLWDVTETWFMGTALCKIVLYFQTVSVAVSVLTLTFISIDRWYAICCPLKFKSTTGRAKKAIVVIWVLALAFDIPEMVVLQTKRKELNIDTIFFTQCEASWSDKTDMGFHCLQTILLYTVPLVFMSIAYYQIVRVLWSSDNIPGHKERLNSSRCITQSTSCRSDTIARKTFKRSISNTVSTSGQVICRRKAAKMLVAVVIMFAVCYFPVHLLSILRYIYDIPQTDATTAFSMVSHWLCYSNSAVNPLIYNFMSGKFRKEFASTFGCRRFTWKRPNGLMRRRRRRQVVASLGDNDIQPAEMTPLSHNGVANGAVDVENRC